jgi:hypothetical protein
MKTLRRHLLSIAAGLAVAGACSTTAWAAPVTVTWNPSGSVPQLSTAGPLTFNDITVQDFASISLTPTGPTTFSVTEFGYLPFVAFSLGGPIVTPGLNGQAGATAYGIYIVFNATSTLTCTSPGNCTGTFTSLSYQMMGDPGYSTHPFTFDPITGNPTVNTAGDFLLASGTLVNCPVITPECQNSASLTNSVPGAAVTGTFNQAPGEAGFFVAPPPTVLLNLLGSFINNTSEVTCFAATAAACGTGPAYGGPIPPGHAGEAILYQVGNPVAGGGSITLVARTVPEPATLLLLGVGLIAVAAGGMRRRKAG